MAQYSNIANTLNALSDININKIFGGNGIISQDQLKILRKNSKNGCECEEKDVCSCSADAKVIKITQRLVNKGTIYLNDNTTALLCEDITVDKKRGTAGFIVVQGTNVKIDLAGHSVLGNVNTPYAIAINGTKRRISGVTITGNGLIANFRLAAIVSLSGNGVKVENTRISNINTSDRTDTSWGFVSPLYFVGTTGSVENVTVVNTISAVINKLYYSTGCLGVNSAINIDGLKVNSVSSVTATGLGVVFNNSIETQTWQNFTNLNITDVSGVDAIGVLRFNNIANVNFVTNLTNNFVGNIKATKLNALAVGVAIINDTIDMDNVKVNGVKNTVPPSGDQLLATGFDTSFTNGDINGNEASNIVATTVLV